jgi:sugar phosphate isomerase/epimerase
MILSLGLAGVRSEDIPKLTSALHKAEVGGIELCSRDLFEDLSAASLEQRQNVCNQLRQTNLPVVSLVGIFTGHPALGLFGGEDTRRQSIAWAREQIRFCDELGSRRLVLGAAPGRNIQPSIRPSEALPLAVEWIEGLLPLLESRDVTLVLDTLPPEDSDFLNTLTDVREILKQVRHPLVRGGLDARAFAAAGENINSLMDEHLPYLAYVRAAEPKLELPGERACLPHMMLSSALGAGGFTGPLVLALHSRYLVPGSQLNTALRRFASWYGLAPQ